MKRTVVVVMLMAIFSGVLAGCSQPKLGADTVALVGGRAITKDSFATRIKLFELFFQQPMDDVNKKQQVLDQMVRDLVLRDQTKDLGVSVADSEVEAEMARFFGALDRTYGGRDAVNAKLQEYGLTNDSIAQFLKDFLVSQAVVEKKKSGVEVSEDEMHAYYDKKKDTLYTFKSNVVRAAHVLVPLDQEAKAQEIAAKAKAGGDFAELARLYSIDPVSASQGGDLGYFARDAMVKEFSDAAFGMDPGRTSDPVRTQFGWHIILVVDKQDPGVLPYDKAKEDVKHRLVMEKQEQTYQAWIVGLEKNAKITKAQVADLVN